MKKLARVVAVFVTTANRREAVKIGKAVVKVKLAACVNIFPEVFSVFRWDGKIENAREVLMIMKTTRDQYHALEREIKSHHSYRVPEIIAVSIESGYRPYLEWVMKESHN
jgi:periplasmic divalent cation tolerance protein